MNNTIIRLTPEVPVDMTLAFAEGKPVSKDRMMFTTTDGRSLFVPEAAGREIQRRLHGLGIRPGDRVLIRQTTSYEHGVKETTWEVHRAQVACGEQRDGSFVVPTQPGAGSPSRIDQPRAAAAAKAPLHDVAGPSLEHSGTAGLIRDRANMLIDVYAGCVRYARARNYDIPPEHILQMVLESAANVKEPR